MIRLCLAAPAKPELIISGVSCPCPVCAFRGVVMVDVVVVDVVVVVVVAGADSDTVDPKMSWAVASIAQLVRAYG